MWSLYRPDAGLVAGGVYVDVGRGGWFGCWEIGDLEGLVRDIGTMEWGMRLVNVFAGRKEKGSSKGENFVEKDKGIRPPIRTNFESKKSKLQ